MAADEQTEVADRPRTRGSKSHASATFRPSDYFPLYRFRIPTDAVDQAIQALPAAQRAEIQQQRNAAAR